MSTSRLAQALSGGDSGTRGPSTDASGDAALENAASQGGGDEGDEDVASLADLGVTEEEIDDIDLSEFTDDERKTIDVAKAKSGKGKTNAQNAKDGKDVKTSEAAKTSEAEGEENEEGEAGEKPPRGFVSIKALQATRSELQALKRRVEEQERDPNSELSRLRAFRDNVAQRLLAKEGGGKDEPKKPAIPDPIKDPIGASQWAIEQVQAMKEASEKKATDDAEARRNAEAASRREEAIINAADDMLNQAATSDKSVGEAFEFAANAIVAKLQKRGLAGDALRRAFRSAVIQYSASAPTDPAEFKEYVFANARYWGWSPGANNGAAANGGGSQQERAAENERTVSEAEKRVKALAEAANKNKSLRGSKSSGGNAELSLDDLAALSGEELEKLASDHPALFEKVTGIK